MKLNWKHFINFGFLFELFLFTFCLVLSIGISLRLMASVSLTNVVSSGPSYSAWQFIILFFIATAFLLVILKYLKKPWLIKVLFYFAILEGLWIFTQAYFSWPYYLVVLLVLVLMWVIYQNILVHDVIIVLAISAIAVIFGFNLMPSAVILILIILAIYDFYAVYKSKHMVKMFKSLAEQKIHFAIIIPINFDSLFKPIKMAKPSTEFMFLGTGDLALPAIFAVSCLKIGIVSSYMTIIGAVIGFIILYILFITQDKKGPMPGLPPIVMGSLIGYFISLIIM